MECVYQLFSHSVIVHWNGKTYSISKDDNRFETILGLIEANRTDQIPALLDRKGGYFAVLAKLRAAAESSEFQTA
jgi:hypothetical protein